MIMASSTVQQANNTNEHSNNMNKETVTRSPGTRAAHKITSFYNPMYAIRIILLIIKIIIVITIPVPSL